MNAWTFTGVFMLLSLRDEKWKTLPLAIVQKLPRQQSKLSCSRLVSGKRAAGGSCREGFAGDDKAQADRHHRQLLVGP